MNFEKLLSKTAPTKDKKVKGKWFSIRFVVDIFANESMNIGVGFIDDKGSVHTRLLDSFHRLQCLYDDRITRDDMIHVINMVQATIPNKLDSDIIPSPSASITYSKPYFASGDSIDEILESSYKDCVSLARPFPDQSTKERYAGKNTEQVREDVYQVIRKDEPMIAERIIAANPMLPVVVKDKTHWIDAPLQGKNALGTILSACQSPNTVRMNIIQSASDMRIISDDKRFDKLACFMLLNHEGSEKSRAIKSIIDKDSWRFAAMGIKLHADNDIQHMATDIIRWSQVANH